MHHFYKGFHSHLNIKGIQFPKVFEDIGCPERCGGRNLNREPLSDGRLVKNICFLLETCWSSALNFSCSEVCSLHLRWSPSPLCQHSLNMQGKTSKLLMAHTSWAFQKSSCPGKHNILKRCEPPQRWRGWRGLEEGRSLQMWNIYLCCRGSKKSGK